MSKRLSLQAFKSWLSEQKDLSQFFDIEGEESSGKDKFAGSMIRSKVSKQKLMERIEADSNQEQMVDEFLSEGGSILAVDGKRVRVEVASGEFVIPRFCVKLIKN
jgi:hypothetical protein